MPAAEKTESPMMRQYHSFKKQHPDSILLFRMGDFYEVFFEDAKTCSRVLGITLTARSKGESAIPMAGVPHHAVEGYLHKLIKAGYHVAICDQVQDPREAKGIVERDVTRIITPGTLTEDALLETKTSNYLAAVISQQGQAGLAWIELSTGQFYVEEIPDAQVIDELARIMPAECLVREGISEKPDSIEAQLGARINCPLTRRSDYVFDFSTALHALTENFKTKSLDGFGCQDLTLGVCAAGALIEYLRETQKTALNHINRLQAYTASKFVLLDQSTRRSLELVSSMRDGSLDGTLLSVLDRTQTAMGGRLLREWTTAPLHNVEDINARLGAVEELVDNSFLRQDLQELLQQVYDLERIAAKVSCLRANARDLVGLKQSSKVLPGIRQKISDCISFLLGGLADHFDTLSDIHDLIQLAIMEDPPNSIQEGGIIASGYNEELDELHLISRDGKSWLADYQAHETEKTDIPSLKVGFNNVFGYYIEVTHVHTGKVPDNYLRKQTLKNAERYITPELKEFESKALSAEERAQDLEYQIFVEIRNKIADHIPRIQQVAENIALLDALASLAEVASRNGYCRPTIDDGLELNIIEGRHPVLEESLLGENFVPNDVSLDPTSNQLLIITGPNMAGKSTYIRQVALITLMAQMGSFVPAQKAQIGVADRIFTRVGAADDLSRGHSTFMVEMHEAANILNNATPRSLIILDEVGRGTSTFDGVSIAWAICEYIVEKSKARTLFATHYHELTALASILEGVKNYSIAVREWGEDIVFLRKIVEGGTDKSYGIHVARLAGVPQKVIKRAQTILKNLESHTIDPTGKPKFAPQPKSKRPHEMQLLLFNFPHEDIIEQLRDLEVDSMTPLDAINRLKELQDHVRSIDGTES
ncbi:MAG: DNA mismatch repair protein MutS [Planctomycetota bacterium]|nr:DNA mismatch repair protein MutS [Planctomycetota bacterium]MDA1138953.1 DNA mismatch repair protein MutS [Planctomycetota bacterium]